MDHFEKYDQRAIYRVPLSGGQQRLKEAILYVSEKCQELPYFGLTKLNKILWRADFRSYSERFQPVTGRQYQRLQAGPAAVEMPPLLRELASAGHLRFELRKMGPLTESRPIPLASPVMRLFSEEDVEYLDEAIAHYRDMTGTETSDESHGTAWKTRSNGDPIPYQAAFFSDAPLSKAKTDKFAAMGREKHWKSQ